MNIEQKRIKIRALVTEANSKFMHFEFVKKNGDVREMTINPKAIQNHLVEEYKSPSTEQAVKTRKANHPELLNVWEVPVGAAKSINMDTVQKIVSDGVTYIFIATEKKTKAKKGEKVKLAK